MLKSVSSMKNMRFDLEENDEENDDKNPDWEDTFENPVWETSCVK